KRCAGQFVDLLHRCADDTFDDPTIMWSAQRSVVQFNAVLLTATGECFTFELGSIVDKQCFRFAAHRPIGFYPQLFQPWPLINGRMRQTQSHRHRRRGLQCDDHAENAPATHINGHRQTWSATRLTLMLVDYYKIKHRMITLD